METQPVTTQPNLTIADRIRFLIPRLRPRATIKLTHEPEDIDPSEHFDNAQELAWAREQLELGNTWTWCQVTVRAEFGGVYGEAHLGACSYANEADFKGDGEPGGYYETLIDEALRELAERVASVGEAYSELLEHEVMRLMPVAIPDDEMRLAFALYDHDADDVPRGEIFDTLVANAAGWAKLDC